MSKSTTEIASGAVRDIEPELRDLFSKVVERDPREAVKMLEAYPDGFVVKMLELLNPRGGDEDPAALQSIPARDDSGHGFFRNNAAVDA